MGQSWVFLLNRKYNIGKHFPALCKAAGISQCIPPHRKMNQSCTFLLPPLIAFSLSLPVEYPEGYSTKKSSKKCCFQLQEPVHPWDTTSHSALQLRSRHFCTVSTHLRHPHRSARWSSVATPQHSSSKQGSRKGFLN